MKSCNKCGRDWCACEPTPAEYDAALEGSALRARWQANQRAMDAAETARRLGLFDARWARLVRAVGAQAERDRKAVA